MSQFHRWKTGTAALMAMAITTGTIAPMFLFTPASAQVIFNGRRTQTPTGKVSIPAGFTMPITYDKDKIVVTPDETTRIKLRVAKNLVDSSRNVLVPEGSEIEGQLQPITRNGEKGTYFVAQDLILPNGERQSINATSRVITRKQEISKGGRTDKIIQDAAIGAGAASVISLITGDRQIQAIEPIIGAGAGAAASVLLRRKKAEVIVIEPQKGDLDLTLRSSLFVSRGYY
ncbi:conjugal transfer protein TrbI [Scytonema tolypothrichoides VB-61278]|nr:conjugal transfer protein TrbI [Scytonema tolypothrichoides VB-61278]